MIGGRWQDRDDRLAVIYVQRIHPGVRSSALSYLSGWGEDRKTGNRHAEDARTWQEEDSISRDDTCPREDAEKTVFTSFRFGWHGTWIGGGSTAALWTPGRELRRAIVTGDRPGPTGNPHCRPPFIHTEFIIRRPPPFLSFSLAILLGP